MARNYQGPRGKDTMLELFKTEEKTEFAFDDPHLNFLYMNGVIDTEETEDNLYVRFSCPFVQKRLFNYFSREIFSYIGKIFEPFEDLKDTITEDSLDMAVRKISQEKQGMAAERCSQAKGSESI